MKRVIEAKFETGVRLQVDHEKSRKNGVTIASTGLNPQGRFDEFAFPMPDESLQAQLTEPIVDKTNRNSIF